MDGAWKDADTSVLHLRHWCTLDYIFTLVLSFISIHLLSFILIRVLSYTFNWVMHLYLDILVNKCLMVRDVFFIGKYICPYIFIWLLHLSYRWCQQYDTKIALHPKVSVREMIAHTGCNNKTFTHNYLPSPEGWQNRRRQIFCSFRAKFLAFCIYVSQWKFIL